VIELTALDVRSKRGDFSRRMRGYDRAEVDSFMELVAERIEKLAGECKELTERLAQVEIQLEAKTERERAVNDALVAAQEMRKDILDTAKRKALLIEQEAEVRGRQIQDKAAAKARARIRECDDETEKVRATLDALERRRAHLLRSMNRILREGMELVEREEAIRPVDGSLSSPRQSFGVRNQEMGNRQRELEMGGGRGKRV